MLFIFAFISTILVLCFVCLATIIKIESCIVILTIICVLLITCGFIVAGILQNRSKVDKKISALKFCIWEKCDEAQVKDASSSSKCKFIFDSISEHPEILKEIYKAYAQAIENL